MIFLSRCFEPVVFVRAKHLYWSRLWSHMGAVWLQGFLSDSQVMKYKQWQKSSYYKKRSRWWNRLKHMIITEEKEVCVSQHRLIIFWLLYDSFGVHTMIWTRESLYTLQVKSCGWDDVVERQCFLHKTENENSQWVEFPAGDVRRGCNEQKIDVGRVCLE